MKATRSVCLDFTQHYIDVAVTGTRRILIENQLNEYTGTCMYSFSMINHALVSLLRGLYSICKLCSSFRAIANALYICGEHSGKHAMLVASAYLCLSTKVLRRYYCRDK